MKGNELCEVYIHAVVRKINTFRNLKKLNQKLNKFKFYISRKISKSKLIGLLESTYKVRVSVSPGVQYIVTKILLKTILLKIFT